MTDEEIEVVAEELAKVGGVTWYPGREKGTLMRIVSDRYRDRARVAIEAIDRHRASKQGANAQSTGTDEIRRASHSSPPIQDNEIKPGATVIYRPPGDRRAYSCRVVEIKGNRAYLSPILRACTDWVSIEHLVPTPADPEPEKVLAHE